MRRLHSTAATGARTTTGSTTTTAPHPRGGAPPSGEHNCPNM